MKTKYRKVKIIRIYLKMNNESDEYLCIRENRRTLLYNLKYQTMKKMLFALFGTLLLAGGCTDRSTTQQAAYLPEWESLAKHEAAPEWFQDAKFGIYLHWGPYCVPEFDNEWYPRKMHFEGFPANEYHKKTYGPLNEFGYHDLIPMFTGEKFDAKEWSDLFRKAGARFAGLVAEHHDGFAMWDSECTPWNAMDMGPKCDVVGELSKNIKANGMKFITTFHHARNLQRYSDPAVYEAEMKKEYEREAKRFSLSHYPWFENIPPRSEDPKLKYLYGNIPEEQWCKEIWLGELEEVIDKYQPDIIYFDSWLNYIPENYIKEFCAYYLNSAEKNGQEVVIIRKQEDLPLDFSVENLEIARKSEISHMTWETETTISDGSWSYTKTMKIKPASQVLHTLIDVVSKNGVFLLNISPTYQGIIPDDQREVLLKIGKWLETNGEAIYGTRAWISYGEGPTMQPEGSFKNSDSFQKLTYTSDDVRFTRKGNTVYVITLGEPVPGTTYRLSSFGQSYLGAEKIIKNVSILGSDAKVDYKLNDQRLTLSVPEGEYDMSAVYKIEFAN